MLRYKLIPLIVLLLASPLATACGDDDPVGGTDTTDTAGGDTTTGDTTPGDDDATWGDDAGPTGDTAMGDDDTAMGGMDTAMGGDDTAMGGMDTAMGGDDTAMGGDDTAMGGDDTAMGGDDTAMGGDDTAMGGDDTAMGGDDAGPDDDVWVPTCSHSCDCAQGQGCVEGACVLGDAAVFCCSNDECPDGEGCVNADDSLGLCGIETSPDFGAVVFNEVLTDGTVDGDPNGDGDAPDSVGDEFVEIVNTTGGDVDLSGFTLLENDFKVKARHTFTAATILAAGEAIVVFGGGTAPEDIDGATFLVANADDPGVPLGLALSNDQDVMQLLDSDGKLVATFAYGPGTGSPEISDESYTRWPDVTGDFTAHSDASGDAEVRFSPGTGADGSSF